MLDITLTSSGLAKSEAYSLYIHVLFLHMKVCKEPDPSGPLRYLHQTDRTYKIMETMALHLDGEQVQVPQLSMAIMHIVVIYPAHIFISSTQFCWHCKLVT